jgi:hypothetical protein
VAQEVLHTDDESATVREMLEVFVEFALVAEFALNEPMKETSARDVRAVVQRFFARAARRTRSRDRQPEPHCTRR